jgi:hypothetical protein
MEKNGPVYDHYNIPRYPLPDEVRYFLLRDSFHLVFILHAADVNHTMPNQRKRSRPDDANQLGVGSTLALLRNEQAQDGTDTANGKLFDDRRVVI